MILIDDKGEECKGDRLRGRLQASPHSSPCIFLPEEAVEDGITLVQRNLSLALGNFRQIHIRHDGGLNLHRYSQNLQICTLC